MADLWFVSKVILVSAGVSALIHYGAPLLQWSPTLPLVLGIVLLPVLGLAIALWWRDRQLTEPLPDDQD